MHTQPQYYTVRDRTGSIHLVSASSLSLQNTRKSGWMRRHYLTGFCLLVLFMMTPSLQIVSPVDAKTVDLLTQKHPSMLPAGEWWIQIEFDQIDFSELQNQNAS